MKSEQQKVQQGPKFVLTIIWAALLFSMLLYLYILQTIPSRDSGVDNELIFNIFVGLGILCAFASQFFYQKAIRGVNAFLKAGSSRDEALEKNFPWFIITWAIGEAIAVFGLVLGFNGVDIMNVYSFFAAAIFLHLFRHPFRL